MATSNISAPANSTVKIGSKLPSVTTTTKTEFIGFDGKTIRSTVDASGKPHRIYKVITTTITVTCFGEDDLTSSTAEEKFVDHVKELGADTKDVLLHTAANVQHALESAGDYIRTQLSSTSSDNTEKDQSNLLHQATALKDVLVQKAMDVKDATVDAIRDLTSPQEQAVTATNAQQKTTTLVVNKKNE